MVNMFFGFKGQLVWQNMMEHVFFLNILSVWVLKDFSPFLSKQKHVPWNQGDFPQHFQWGANAEKNLAKWHGPWPKTGNLVKEVSWYADKRQQRQIWYVFLGSYKNIYCMQNLMLWRCDWCWGTLIQDPNRLSLWLLDGLQRFKKKCASYDQLKHAVIWIWAGGIFAIWSKQSVLQMYVPSKICQFGWNTLCNVQR